MVFSYLFIILSLFIYGSILSSFLSLVGYRVPFGISIVKPDSMCGSCNHKLSYRDLIPVISYIINKGKCRFCNDKYGSFHLKLEILLGFLYVIFGFSLYYLNDSILDINLLILFIMFILGLSIFNINLVSISVHKKILIKTNIVLIILTFLCYIMSSVLFAFNILFFTIFIILNILILMSVIYLYYVKGVDTSE